MGKGKGLEIITYICGAHDTTDLLHGVEIWTETTMHGKDLLVNARSNRQTVEAISEGFPEFNVVPPLAFIVKAIDSVDRSTFVVSS